jgi:hypothetical protein
MPPCRPTICSPGSTIGGCSAAMPGGSGPRTCSTTLHASYNIPPRRVRRVCRASVRVYGDGQPQPPGERRVADRRARGDHCVLAASEQEPLDEELCSRRVRALAEVLDRAAQVEDLSHPRCAHRCAAAVVSSQAWGGTSSPRYSCESCWISFLSVIRKNLVCAAEHRAAAPRRGCPDAERRTARPDDPASAGADGARRRMAHLVFAGEAHRACAGEHLCVAFVDDPRVVAVRQDRLPVVLELACGRTRPSPTAAPRSGKQGKQLRGV